jgi:hypothetical protein
MPNPTLNNWFHPFNDGTWHGKFLAKIFNWMYSDLLVPWFEWNGYEVIAGKRNPKTGVIPKPMLVNARTKRSVKSYDFLLKKNGKYYIGWGKFWPTFNEHYTKSYYKWTYKSNPFFFNFNPKQYLVKVGNDYYPIHGKFLYWWDKADISMYKKHHINWIWSIRECFHYMAKNGNYDYYWWIRNYKSWFNSYWNGLAWNSSNIKTKVYPKRKPVTKARRKPVVKARRRPVSKTKPRRKPATRTRPKLRVVSRRPATRRRVSTPSYRRKAA